MDDWLLYVFVSCLVWALLTGAVLVSCVNGDSDD
jgi:hypothetical protein